MSLPIRTRMTLWNVVLLATVIAALGAFLVLQLRLDLRDEIDEEATTTSRTLERSAAHEIQERVAGQPVDVQQMAEDFVDTAASSLPPSGGAQLLDQRGRVVASFGAVARSGSLVPRSTRGDALARGSTTYDAELGDGETPYRVRVTALDQGGATWLVAVAVATERVDAAVRRVLVLLLIGGPITLAAAASVSYWLARRALLPVERMTSDAQEIGAGQLHERVAVPATRDEIAKLGVTLNAMLDRIEQGVTDKQRLVADASHDLRTPLAVMRAEFDVSLRADDLPVAAREVLESARDEVDRMRRTVDNLLALAQLDDGRLELLTVRVSIGQAIEDAARPLRPLAAAKEQDLLVDGGHWDAQADPQRLHLALTNLIENAIKFSPPGGTVRVVGWQRDGEVGVSVSDEGPGIPPEERERLFDRFYRSDSARENRSAGTGLGLAICREIAVAHGGRLWVDSVVGQGSTFSLALPGWRALPSQEDRRQTAPAAHPAGTS